MKANDLTQFSFKFAGAGHYYVTYTTKKGDFYKALVTDMTIIDNTKNAEYAKLSDIKHLRYIVTHNGRHYHSNGIAFD